VARAPQGDDARWSASIALLSLCAAAGGGTGEEAAGGPGACPTAAASFLKSHSVDTDVDSDASLGDLASSSGSDGGAQGWSDEEGGGGAGGEAEPGAGRVRMLPDGLLPDGVLPDGGWGSSSSDAESFGEEDEGCSEEDEGSDESTDSEGGPLTRAPSAHAAPPLHQGGGPVPSRSEASLGGWAAPADAHDDACSPDASCPPSQGAGAPAPTPACQAVWQGSFSFWAPTAAAAEPAHAGGCDADDACGEASVGLPRLEGASAAAPAPGCAPADGGGVTSSPPPPFSFPTLLLGLGAAQ
jgi:hypothetical protein